MWTVTREDGGKVVIKNCKITCDENGGWVIEPLCEDERKLKPPEPQKELRSVIAELKFSAKYALDSGWTQMQFIEQANVCFTHVRMGK